MEKLAKIESEFYKHIDLVTAAGKTGLDAELLDFIFRYWLLKRKAGGNKPLLAQRSTEAQLLSASLGSQETEREKLKRFVALRQDLERVRNLCYMVNRREKLRRTWIKHRENIFAKQLQLLSDKRCAQQMSLAEMSAVLEANHGPTVYDRSFAHSDAETHTEGDFLAIVSRISGEIAENSAQIRKDRSGQAGGSSSGWHSGGFGSSMDNQNSAAYERIFSDMSASETDDILNINSAPADDGRVASKGSRKPAVAGRKPKKVAAKGGKKKAVTTSGKRPTTAQTSDSSDESDRERGRAKKKPSVSKTAGSKTTSKSLFTDTESDGSRSRPKTPPTFVRTKAAMKDFSVEELTRSRKGGEKAKKVSAADKAKSASQKRPGQRGRPPKTTRSSSGSGSDSDGGHAAQVAAAAEQAGVDLADLDGDFYPMIVPERAAARKAAAKLRVSQNDRGAVEPLQREMYDFDAFDTVANNIPKDVLGALKASDMPPSYVASSTSHLSSSKYKRLFDDGSSGSSDDSLNAADIKKKATAKGKKKPASSASTLGYVPERKAAKKAAAHLRDGSGVAGRDESAHRKSPGRRRKKGEPPPSVSATSSFAERIRLSDTDSDDESPFPAKSPLGKSPRGRTGGAAPKSPRKKPSGASARASHHHASSNAHSGGGKAVPKSKGLSSAAEAFLSQRESQGDDTREE